jgi:hypothetical protein
VAEVRSGSQKLRLLLSRQIVLGWYTLDGCAMNAPVVDEPSHTAEWQHDLSEAFQMDTVPGVDLLASLDANMATMGLLEPLDALMNTTNTAHTWQSRSEEVTLEEALSVATYVPLQPVPHTSISAYHQAHIAYVASKIVELNAWTSSNRSVQRASTFSILDEAVSPSATLRQSQTWPVLPVDVRPAPPQTSVADTMDLDLPQGQVPYQADSGPAESQL